MNAWTRCCCLLTLSFVAAPALAQSDPNQRSYVPFDIDPNAAEIVKKRLQLDKDLGPFKDLINQVLKNPKGVDPELLKKFGGVKNQDEKLKRAVQEMFEKDPKLQKDLQEWIEKTKAGNPGAEVKKSLKELDQFLKQPKKTPAKIDVSKQASGTTTNPDAKPPDTMAKTVEKAMKQAENSDLGDWLKNSPAWQQAFRDLRTSLDSPRAGQSKLGDWPGKFLAPDGKVWKLGEETLARIKDMPRPGLERWRDKVKLPGLGQLPTPNLAPPSLPTLNAPSLPSLGAAASWLLLAFGCVLAGWQLMRWSKRPVAVVDWRASLGPWPVRPELVATRGDLVQAFDYLAILTLGQDAKSLNHQAVARRWRANTPAQSPSAAALAELYEQARYTDGSPKLTQAQRDQARQALLQIAEAR